MSCTLNLVAIILCENVGVYSYYEDCEGYLYGCGSGTIKKTVEMRSIPTGYNWNKEGMSPCRVGETLEDLKHQVRNLEIFHKYSITTDTKEMDRLLMVRELMK